MTHNKSSVTEVSVELLQELIARILQDQAGSLQDQIKVLEQKVAAQQEILQQVFQKTSSSGKGNMVSMAVVERILKTLHPPLPLMPKGSPPTLTNPPKRQHSPEYPPEKSPEPLLLPPRWKEMYCTAVGTILVQDSIWRAHGATCLAGNLVPLFTAMAGAHGQGLRERINRKRFLLALAAWGPAFWSSYAIASGAFRWLGEDFAAAAQDIINIRIPRMGGGYLLDRWHANFTRLARRLALDGVTIDWGDAPRKGTRFSPRQWQVVSALLRHGNTPMTGDEIARDILHSEWQMFNLPAPPAAEFPPNDVAPAVEEWRGQLRDACARYAQQRGFLGILPSTEERNRRYYLQVTFQRFILQPSAFFEECQGEIFRQICERHGLHTNGGPIIVNSISEMVPICAALAEVSDI